MCSEVLSWMGAVLFGLTMSFAVLAFEYLR